MNKINAIRMGVFNAMNNAVILMSSNEFFQLTIYFCFVLTISLLFVF